MKLASPLLQGVLIKRYKRFLADIQLPDGSIVTAHCPNSGSMKGLLDPGNPVWISRQNSPTRKLPYTLELIQVKNTLVGVNTQHPNRIILEALNQKQIPLLAGYSYIQQEAKYKDSRFDFLLKGDHQNPMYAEVKNVTLLENGMALFPDAVTERGTKHLKGLMEAIDEGFGACMIYVVQRQDCKSFATAPSIDPVYAKTFLQAQQKGVDILVYDCIVRENEVYLNRPLPIHTLTL